MKEKNVIEKLLELPEEKLDKIIEKLTSKESEKLMYQLWDLINVLPEKCRINKLKQFISLTKLKIKYNESHNECYCDKNIQGDH